MTLPPLILVAGHSPSREQKCFTLAKWLKSGTSPGRIFMTDVTSRPLVRVRSTPAQSARPMRTSQSVQVLLPAFGTLPKLTLARLRSMSSVCSLEPHSARRYPMPLVFATMGVVAE